MRSKTSGCAIKLRNVKPCGFYISLHTRWTPGASCLKVVAIEIGGTTALEFHCSGSWPAWIAKVPKCGKDFPICFESESFAILEEEKERARGKTWRNKTLALFRLYLHETCIILRLLLSWNSTSRLYWRSSLSSKGSQIVSGGQIKSWLSRVQCPTPFHTPVLPDDSTTSGFRKCCTGYPGSRADQTSGTELKDLPGTWSLVIQETKKWQ